MQEEKDKSGKEDMAAPHPETPPLENPVVAEDTPEAGVQTEAALREELANMKDQLLRALAEAENTRRRAQREREDLQKFAVTAFARDILQVADNLERALGAIPTDALADDALLKGLYEGVQATERQLEGSLAKQHIKKIVPLGEKFDSNLHQAMFEVENSGQPAGHVAQVLAAGYLIHDRLLRPAMVAVSKAADGGAGSNTQAPHIDTQA
ncbi:MAG TPA: nucleotide exchange factor GrpE [Dongiaceae bacterium]|jgi:molecular chaperone GrpE|nr:nucleotide exchange factor GrpE [Dongiaceae bacterium]